MTCPETVELGAYVLGAAELDERSHAEAHLADCTDCRAELTRLAPLPHLLSELTAEDVHIIEQELSGAAAQGADPSDLGTRHRLSRARLVSLASAGAAAVAAAVVVTAAVGPGIGIGGAPGDVSADRSLSATDPSTGVRATALLYGRSWGTEVALRMHDVPPEQVCHLVVRTRDGRVELSGSWSTAYEGSVDVPVPVSVSPAQISGLEVVTADEHVLVRLPQPSSEGNSLHA
jgi:hypothetical protein